LDAKFVSRSRGPAERTASRCVFAAGPLGRRTLFRNAAPSISSPFEASIPCPPLMELIAAVVAFKVQSWSITRIL
jgi:hypothetical protein